VVKPGDSFGSIAERTGVPIERLEELNPDVDPQALVVGQRLRLRE
jgi:LysM repeat protein